MELAAISRRADAAEEGDSEATADLVDPTCPDASAGLKLAPKARPRLQRRRCITVPVAPVRHSWLASLIHCAGTLSRPIPGTYLAPIGVPLGRGPSSARAGPRHATDAAATSSQCGGVHHL